MKEAMRLVREWWRQWSLLECPFCGVAGVRRSTRRQCGAGDGVALDPALQVRPLQAQVLPSQAGGAHLDAYQVTHRLEP